MAFRKNVLLVSYYFPPLGMGGIGRPYALFRYLPDHGYDVTVLTVKNISYPEYDYSLLNESDEKSIVRTGSLDPSRILHMIGVRKMKSAVSSSPGTAVCNFPDSKRGWVRFALAGAKRIMGNSDISAVITTSPPPSSHIVGLKLKEKFNVKWIADFRDFWFSLPIELVYPMQIQKSHAQRLKDRIVESADAIAAVNNSVVDYLGRGEVVMNGADPAVIGYWRSKSRRPAEKFIIGSLGTVNYLCPVEPLFKIITSLKNSDASLAGKIEIVHVGHYDEKMINELTDQYGLQSVVSFRGYMPKAKAIETLATADMLYLSVADFGDYHILPGRVFDYLLSGKPILGVVPQGSDVAALLGEYGRGMVVTPDDLSGAVTFIRKVYDERLAGLSEKTLDAETASRYMTPEVAAQYAKILDRVTG
jgi:glycosyltransferase involved in cell wall biosynthesis